MRLLILFLSITFFLDETICQKFIQLTSPNNGETWEAASSDTITWNARDIANIKIEYCSDYNSFPGPNNWINIVNTTPASTGFYVWNIPNFDNSIRIRISDASDPSVSDVSDADISIWSPVLNPKSVLLEIPSGGETLESGTEYFTLSVKNQNVSTLVFEFSSDNGQNWERVDTLVGFGNEIYESYPSAFKTYNWKIPYVNSNQCKIRVSELNNPSIFDESDVFTISNSVSKKVEMLFPNDPYTVMFYGAPDVIYWNTTGVTNVRVDYTYYFQGTGNATQWNTAGIYPAANGQVTLNFPSLFTTTGRFKIMDAADTTYYDISDNDFWINYWTPFEVTLTSPTSSSTWDTASTYNNVTWTYQGNAFEYDLEFQFSSDGGSSWNTEDDFYSNGNKIGALKNYIGAKSLNWDVPNIVSNQCYLRIVNKNTNFVYDQVGPFTLEGNPSKYVELVSINGGDIAVDTTYYISWNSSGISNVKLEYAQYFNTTHNTANTWNVFQASVPASQGSSGITFLNTTLTFHRWRVSDASDPSMNDISDGDVTIYDNALTPRELDIEYPNGGEVLLGGSSFDNVCWRSNNYFGEVEIQYTLDNGVNWITIDPYIVTSSSIDHQEVNAVYATQKSINWNVPDVNSSTCRVRIFDPNNPGLMDMSDQTFTIVKDTSSSVSVEYIGDIGQVSIYPNPFRNELTLEFDNVDLLNGSYQVFNMLGSFIESGNINSENYTINTSEWENGVYIVKLIGDSFEKSVRCIKGR